MRDQVYKSVLIIPDDFSFRVENHIHYPGSFVNKRIEAAVKAEHDRMYAKHIASDKLRDCNDNLMNTLDRSTDVIVALAGSAVWQPLKVYLTDRNIHNALMGQITSFNDAIKRQNEAGFFLIQADAPQLAELNSVVHGLAFSVEEFTEADDKQLSYYGQQLVEYIRQKTINNEAMLLYNNIRAAIDVGGRGESPLLLAIYNIGNQFYLQTRTGNKPKWKTIAEQIWKSINGKTSLTDEESLIYEAWKYSAHLPIKSGDPRYNTVRDAFRNRKRDIVVQSGI